MDIVMKTFSTANNNFGMPFNQPLKNLFSQNSLPD